jgi:endoglucanase
MAVAVIAVPAVLTAAPANATVTVQHAGVITSTLSFIGNYNSGFCLGIGGGSTVNGAGVVQFSCINGHPDQQWHSGGTIAGGYYQIVNGDGKCLAVGGGSTVAGARVVGWTCEGTSHPDQYWRIETGYNCDGYHPIFNYNARGDALGVSGNSHAEFAHVVIWPFQGGCNNQFWKPSRIGYFKHGPRTA